MSSSHTLARHVILEEHWPSAKTYENREHKVASTKKWQTLFLGNESKTMQDYIGDSSSNMLLNPMLCQKLKKPLLHFTLAAKAQVVFRWRRTMENNVGFLQLSTAVLTNPRHPNTF